MIPEARALLSLHEPDFNDVGLEREEFVDWAGHETTEKVMRMVFKQREAIKEQLAMGGTLTERPERHTAEAVGLIAGLDFFLTMEFVDEDERGEDESDTTEYADD